MGKPFRDPQLPLVFPRKVNPHPLAKCRRAFSYIHCNIKHFTRDTAHQFTLGVGRQLIVQAA
ncbi:hypothetical protein B224_3401 [Aeromonas media WS]|nr:hypothetical protein B224_3401 [Aeromonas media WS]